MSFNFMGVIMKPVNFRMAVCSVVYLIFSSAGINAEYFEGIDTTDSAGFGFDSSFGISSGYIDGNNIIRYTPDAGATIAYLNCSFEDLKIIPDTAREDAQWYMGNYFVFAVHNKKDSTYSKVQVIKQIEDGRYIYKYGTNTVPNNKLLIDTGYDRSIKYKPNNLYNWIHGLNNPNGAFLQWDSLYWDPPIQNNNHLLGYILYASKSKGGVGIDTAKPIDTTQWDSIAFYPNLFKKAEVSLSVNGCYINLVALYEEGKSEFLDGWTMLNVIPVGVVKPKPEFSPLQKKLNISTVPGGVFVTAPYSSSTEPFSVSLFNPNGSLHSRISSIRGNRTLLGNNFAVGLYLLRAEFPDRSVITQPFVVSH
jgi:hypothetical protein